MINEFLNRRESFMAEKKTKTNKSNNNDRKKKGNVTTLPTFYTNIKICLLYTSPSPRDA